MGWLIMIAIAVGAAVTYWPITIAVVAIGIWWGFRKWQRRPRDVYTDAVVLEVPNPPHKVDVVGEGSYQGSLERVSGGRTVDGAAVRDHTALLVPEPDNRYDANAVQVRISGLVVGYLSRADAVAYRPAVDFAASRGVVIGAPAELRGGWMRDDGDRGHFGVVLHMQDPHGVLAELVAWAAERERHPAQVNPV